MLSKEKLSEIIKNNSLFYSKHNKLLLLIILPILTVFLVLITYSVYFSGKIFPEVYIADISVSGLKPGQAKQRIREINPPETVILIGKNQKFEIPTESIELKYDYDESVKEAYNTHRTNNALANLVDQLGAPFSKKVNGLKIDLNEDKLSESISAVAGQIAVEPTYPFVITEGKEILINSGETGIDIDLNFLRTLIYQNLSFAKTDPIIVPIFVVDPTLSETQASDFKQRVEKLFDKRLVLNFENQEYGYEKDDLFVLLDGKEKYNQMTLEELAMKVAKELDRDPQNPVFEFNNNRVEEFLPAKEGVQVNQERLIALITDQLSILETTQEELASLQIPSTNSQPDYSTEEVNDLGIKELIGRGTSEYRGSISSRIHNIAVASTNFNGVLVKPDQTFSFNQILGDVSEYTGYKQAYIIKDGKTVLGDGGGVCQVSTTLFRAALDAGLPIAERRAHSYRVTYYEQDSLPGLDATVYAPTTDLKITNDTPGHILIQTLVDTKAATLVFEIYGTNDGRIASITKPVVSGIVPPPEDSYTDDPTLPAGEIKQIDWKAAGAKVSFDYTVEKDGETVYEKTFYSNFRPWQAKFLRGTGENI